MNNISQGVSDVTTIMEIVRGLAFCAILNMDTHLIVQQKNAKAHLQSTSFQPQNQLHVKNYMKLEVSHVVNALLATM